MYVLGAVWIAKVLNNPRLIACRRTCLASQREVQAGGSGDEERDKAARVPGPVASASGNRSSSLIDWSLCYGVPHETDNVSSVRVLGTNANESSAPCTYRSAYGGITITSVFVVSFLSVSCCGLSAHFFVSVWQRQRQRHRGRHGGWRRKSDDGVGLLRVCIQGTGIFLTVCILVATLIFLVHCVLLLSADDTVYDVCFRASVVSRAVYLAYPCVRQHTVTDTPTHDARIYSCDEVMAGVVSDWWGLHDWSACLVNPMPVRAVHTAVWLLCILVLVTLVFLTAHVLDILVTKSRKRTVVSVHLLS